MPTGPAKLAPEPARPQPMTVPSACSAAIARSLPATATTFCGWAGRAEVSPPRRRRWTASVRSALSTANTDGALNTFCGTRVWLALTQPQLTEAVSG